MEMSGVVAGAAGGTSDDIGARAATALRRAQEHLFSLQSPEGWWKGELETNVTMDAEDLLLREFLGIRTEADTAETAAWIRSQQRSDGSWATFYEGPADLSTTFEAYVALRLAGDEPSEPHMAKAAAFVREAGGIERTRVFTRLWMALFGLWSWDELPALPPEVVFLPPWFPLNIYDFACWARQTIVALTVVAAHRPARPLGFGIEELRSGLPPKSPASRRTVDGAFEVLDRVLHGYERWATRGRGARPRRLRSAALVAAERWIVKRQEADGGWGGIQPPWVYSIMALSLQGYALDHPVMERAIAGLEGFTIRENGMRRLEACQSPVWDTALAMVALADAGVHATAEPRLQRAAEWIVEEEISMRGDWAVRRPDVEPGGWAFEFANDNYPDVDDTAEVILALRKAGVAAGPVAAAGADAAAGAIERGRRWVEGMVSSNGAWGAFDADNTREICTRLPFCDFGAVIDPPSADVTAHVIEMLAHELDAGSVPDSQRAATEALIAGGVRWLSAEQEADGSWFGRWGANYVYGVGAVLPALVAAGVPLDDRRIQRGVRWLVGHQNDDGGFGEDLRSYRDAEQAGRGASTASQTAWALLALLAAGEGSRTATRRAVEWLVSTQRPDGTWDEPWFTGTGFPGDFYINYHLYRLVFPISALGRFVTSGGPGS